MMKKHIFFAALLVTMTYFSCSLSEIDDDESSIYGVVNDRTTGEPIANVRVNLMPSNKSVYTSSDGYYMFEVLEDLNCRPCTITLQHDAYEVDRVSLSSGPGPNENLRRDFSLRQKE